MKRIFLYISVFLLIIISVAGIQNLRSEPTTYYAYLTDIETTRNNEIIWFWGSDSFEGPFRSNDLIGFRPLNVDTFYFNGPFYSRYPKEAVFGGDWPDYQSPVLIGGPFYFNCLPYRYPESYSHLQDDADLTIEGGRYMTRIQFADTNGVNIFRYPRGNSPPPLWEEDSLQYNLDLDTVDVIYVDGECEVYGVMQGRLTVYSERNMWLMDNVRYAGSDERTGDFNEEYMRHMLALVSQKNIIIKDTYWNGREDGFTQFSPYRADRHSIVINGSLIALDESFTFEHQNDRWEPYQGPTPDERGIIHFKGSLAQKRRGYVHRSNHIGTGYGKRYRYDERLKNAAPPGFEAGDYFEITGYYRNVHLSVGPYQVYRAIIDTLTIHEGVEVAIQGMDGLTVKEVLYIKGSEENPAIVKCIEDQPAAMLRVGSGSPKMVNIQHARFLNGMNATFKADTILITDSEFGGEVDIQQILGDCQITNCVFQENVKIEAWDNLITNCVFQENVKIEAWDNLTVEKSVLESGLHLTGNVRNGEIHNNTIVGAHLEGIRIDRFRNLDIRNNIIAFNRDGILNRYHTTPVLAYNDVYGNVEDDYIDCEAGEGSISADPLFVDHDGGDYHLIWGSPCIDAGDPSDHRDADGSITEMGAYYYDHELAVENNFHQPEEFSVTAFPNPFNNVTQLNFSGLANSDITISIYDYSGRLIQQERMQASSGKYNYKVSGYLLGASGIYFARVVSPDDQIILKLLYLP